VATGFSASRTTPTRAETRSPDQLLNAAFLALMVTERALACPRDLTQTGTAISKPVPEKDVTMVRNHHPKEGTR
jgi:hypothetical protein